MTGMKVKDYKSMDEHQLKQYTKELGLDPIGPRSTIINRITTFLKLKGKQIPVSLNNSNKKKKKKSNRKIIQTTDEVKNIVIPPHSYNN